MVGFSSASLFPPRKWEAVTLGGTRGKDLHLVGGKPREPVPSKAGSTSKITGTFQIHSRKTRITQAQAT